MADLEQALDRLLGDPKAMEQIMDLAGKLNGEATAGTGDDGADGPSFRDAPAPEGSPAGALPDLGQLAPLLSLLREGGGGDPRSDALLKALRPFLSPQRQRKLDRAMRLSALARTASEAMRLWKEGELSV